MSKTLVILAHPDMSSSRINRRLFQEIHEKPNLEISNLYARYSDFIINIEAEQELLSHADVIILQHPFYWYSYPALLKEWLDKVLQKGFAYGAGGDKLTNKILLSAVSADGTFKGYQLQGYNRFTIKELLRHLELTAKYCKMIYLDPLVIYDTDNISGEDLEHEAVKYSRLIDSLQEHTSSGFV